VHKTFTATHGTAFYRVRTPAETVNLGLTLMAQDCPLQAIVFAFGLSLMREFVDIDMEA
jgi:hypothetical protein